MKGTIARVTPSGYGFIKPDEGDKDVFFHAHSLVSLAFDDLQQGDPVTFEIDDSGPKGPAAVNVERA